MLSCNLLSWHFVALAFVISVLVDLIMADYVILHYLLELKVKRCMVATIIVEMLEEDEKRVRRRGKTRSWIRRRKEKGYFNNIVQELMIEDTPGYREMMRMIHDDFLAILRRIEPDITPPSGNWWPQGY